MHSGTLLSKAEYSLMDRWFQFASEYYKKYVQPDVIGKTNLYVDQISAHYQYQHMCCLHLIICVYFWTRKGFFTSEGRFSRSQKTNYQNLYRYRQWTEV